MSAIAMKPGEFLGSAQPWPAVAKLNLCLHIVGRREDGYHLLQSAIQFIDLQDELEFFRRPRGVIERVAGPPEVPAEQDLAIRAAQLLAAHSAPPSGVAIALHKRIPMQAGLGGASSDAATTLVALNRLWGIDLGLPELAALGAKLGADVPVFVHGHAAWVEGIGELITPCDYDEAIFLVIKPRAAISTAETFNARELTRNTPVTTIRALHSSDRSPNDLAEGGSLRWPGRNDCTSVVRNRYPEVGGALDWLGSFPQVKYGARLTGTGACVFAQLPTAQDAERILGQMPAEWRGYVVRGLNRSPLVQRLAAESTMHKA